MDSPAYTAGVMAKDILVAVDGHKIESLKQAAKMIKNKSRYCNAYEMPVELHVSNISNMRDSVSSGYPNTEKRERELLYHNAGVKK